MVNSEIFIGKNHLFKAMNRKGVSKIIDARAFPLAAMRNPSLSQETAEVCVDIDFGYHAVIRRGKEILMSSEFAMHFCRIIAAHRRQLL